MLLGTLDGFLFRRVRPPRCEARAPAPPRGRAYRISRRRDTSGTDAQFPRSIAGRLKPLACIPQRIFLGGPISLIAPCLKISLGAFRQEHLPRAPEVGAGLVEGGGCAALLFARLRSRIKNRNAHDQADQIALYVWVPPRRGKVAPRHRINQRLWSTLPWHPSYRDGSPLCPSLDKNVCRRNY
jgi:hypothetical protein